MRYIKLIEIVQQPKYQIFIFTYFRSTKLQNFSKFTLQGRDLRYFKTVILHI